MGYKLIITNRAEELLDVLVRYLLYRIKSKQAASHLLDCVDKIYELLEENPYQFPACKDDYLAHRGYKEALLHDMNYIIIFKVEGKEVFVLGIFHELEQYKDKL